MRVSPLRFPARKRSPNVCLRCCPQSTRPMEQPGDDVAGADPRLAGLADEAIWLARLTVQLAPDQPRRSACFPRYSTARRGGRRGGAPDGAFIPLRDQDAALWFREMMAEAEAALHAAARMARPGRFQTEAAIQSLHAQGRSSGEQLQRHARAAL